MLPEIKGRSLEEIDELFQNRVSVKDFPKYECKSSARARQIVVEEAIKGNGGIQVAETEQESQDEKKQAS